MGWRRKKKSRYGGFPAYVSVAERREQAAAKIIALRKDSKEIRPVVVDSRIIAKTFWGKAWCGNLEAYSDYANRLPRGRSYARNGAVIDLQITDGEINALVLGSSTYAVKISIKAVSDQKWQNLVAECVGKIDSLIELLQGKMSKGLMQVMANCDNGLFPHPKEIKFTCSCLDWADMCKHVVAALYGVGARIDERPADLFLLRCVEYEELITRANILPIEIGVDGNAHISQVIKDDELCGLFGIDIDAGVAGNGAANNKKELELDLYKKASASKGVVSVKKNKAKVKTASQPKEVRKTQKFTVKSSKKVVVKLSRSQNAAVR